MGIETLAEESDALCEPVYGPYRYARSLIGPDSRVLDIGCGNGKVSAYLARTGALVDGVEPAPSRMDAARGQVRYLSTVPAGEPDPNLLPEYDLITFFDVIEHLADPGPVLDWAAHKLAPGGHLVASIPNSAHYSFRLKILRGDWSMTDWGLFDRTHLRFFDRRTAAQLSPKGCILAGIADFSPRDQRPAYRAMTRLSPNLFSLHFTLTWEKFQPEQEV